MGFDTIEINLVKEEVKQMVKSKDGRVENKHGKNPLGGGGQK